MLQSSNSFNNKYSSFINELINCKSLIDSIKDLQIKYDDCSNYYGKDFSFKKFYENRTNKVFVGCSVDFLNLLNSKGLVFPKLGVSDGNGRESSYEIMSSALGWGGMFFGWHIPKESFDYSDTKSNYVLLTLEIPTEYLVPHGYYEWSDFIFPLIDSNSLEDAEETCKAEFGMSLNEKKVSTFYPNFDNPGVEVFIKCLDKNWIVNQKFIKSILI